MDKTYKVESKGSLFEVTLEHGAYSDWSIEHYIFAGNSEDEVWELVKKWASQNGTGDLGDNEYFRKRGLVWGHKQYRFTDKPKYDDLNDGEFNWETDYGDAYEVRIKRAEVIYVH